MTIKTTAWLMAISLPMLSMSAAEQPASSTPRTAAQTEVELAETDRGCRVTVYASNSSRSDIWLRSEDSRVRAKVWTPVGRKWMTWKSPLPMSNRRIRPGRSVSMTMELDFGCKTPKGYEFMFKRGSDSAWKKVGGSSGTTSQRLRLGDAAKLF